jgi:hypothetical protein
MRPGSTVRHVRSRKREAKARERRVDVRFLVGDVLGLARFDERWNTALD